MKSRALEKMRYAVFKSTVPWNKAKGARRYKQIKKFNGSEGNLCLE